MVATAEITETLSREEYVYMAKLAEKSERYEEMSEFMRSLVTSLEPSSELTAEERKMVSASLKHEVGSLRAAWRIVSSIDRRDAAKGQKESALNRAYRARVEARLFVAVKSVLEFVDSSLLPIAAEAKSRVFFLKMKGDYHRYLAEIQSGHDRADSAQETLASYLAAQDLAEAEIPANDPIRLGLALNFSVFYHDILNEHDKACSLANQAFEDGIAESDSVVGEESNKESHMILGLLRDNLRTWTSDFRKARHVVFG